MKKYFYLLFVALMATASFSLTSCSDDDDTKDFKTDNKALVGTWSETIPDTSNLPADEQDSRYPKGGTFTATFTEPNVMTFNMEYIGNLTDDQGNVTQQNATIKKNFVGTYKLKKDDNQSKTYWLTYEGTLTQEGKAGVESKVGKYDTHVSFYTDKETGKKMVSISFEGVRYEMARQ